MSPDGRYVVYSQQKTDKNSEKKYTNLWLADLSVAGSAPRQFTYGNQSDVNPQWSPDGQSIAFVSNRGNERQMQIYVIPLLGGEARPITQLEGSIGGFAWSPDGTKFVLTFTQKDEAVKAREEDEQKKQLGVVERHITEVLYKFDGAGYLPQEKPHIWVVDAETGEATQLTDGVSGESEPIWSPDGAQILFSATRSENWEFDEVNDFYLMPATGGDAVPIVAHDGAKYAPSFSPDGRLLAYRGRHRKDGHWYQNEDLFVVPLASDDGTVRNLSRPYDHCMGTSTLGDFGSPAPQPAPTWSPDGRYVYGTSTRHGGNPLLRFGVGYFRYNSSSQRSR
ncbi:MAG: hypothetical protein F6K62_20765, partial [Sphaerospermopsis sp. SIO1G2]|nr:hypothetical protein [Sphaerospermopsis sp. SIO1G2]